MEGGDLPFARAARLGYTKAKADALGCTVHAIPIDGYAVAMLSAVVFLTDTIVRPALDLNRTSQSKASR
jgi:hypothetical protein